MEVFLVLWLTTVNRAFNCERRPAWTRSLSHFYQFVLVKRRTGRVHIWQVVGQKSVTVQCFGEGSFGGGELIFSLEWTVGEVFNSVLFLFVESGLSFFLVFGVVHGCHLHKLIFFGWFLFFSCRLLLSQGLVRFAAEHGCFRCKIYWRLVIVFIHFGNVERNQFGGGASLVLNEAGFVEVIAGLRNFFFSRLLVVGLHLLHVLWQSHSLFKSGPHISFNIIVHL